MSSNAVLAALRDAPHVSVSAVKAFLQCPMKYAHRYVHHTPATHRAAALIVGSAVHHAVAAFYEFLGAHGEEPSVNLLLEIFSESWSNSLVGDPPVQADDVGAETEVGVELVRVFHAQALRPRKVLAVEEPFALPLQVLAPHGDPDLLIVGALDAVLLDQQGRVVVVELKTAKRRWSADQLAWDFQPTIYQVAAREAGFAEHPALRLDFLVKTKRPEFATAEIARTWAQEVEAGKVFAQVLRAVDAGIFYPVRSWACADCEFAHACK